MWYRYFVCFWHSISVFVKFSCGIGVLSSPQCPLLDKFAAFLLKAVLKTESNDCAALVTSAPKLPHTDHCPYFSWLTVLQVDSVFETFDQFFNLSPEVKAKYVKKKITVQNVTPQNGWDAIEAERSVVLDNSIYYICTPYSLLRSFEFPPMRNVNFSSSSLPKAPI